VPSAQFLADVTDLFTPGTTTSDTVDFYEETTFTNAAAETAEGSAAAESALDFTLRSFTVQEFSTFIPVTRRSLADVAGLQSYVEGRLGHMLNLRRSAQLLTGNGTSPNIRGILQTSGIQTQAKGSDPTPDAVYKAMVLARTTGDAEPTGVIFHAQDWQDVRLLRTIDGVYIWGNPSEAGPERIWGNQVRVSNSITQNTALVGGFRPYAQIFRRDGAAIEVSTEHSTFFTERKAAVLIYERLALAVYRPAAFVQVTGV
jgi:HK97 family phage major capsid protein